jgi:hypothetical protein
MTKSTKKIFLSLLTIGFLAYAPLQVKAWGMLGHRIVGQIADSYLKPKTKKAIEAVMGGESLAMSANWGDFIKSDSTYNYMYNWHFVNFPASLDKQGVFNFLDAQTEPSVYTKIPELVAILKDSKSSLDKKKFAIRMLVHMVGDMHQPMHTARKEDLGGNRVQLTWFGEKSNLHKVWDEGLIDYQQLSYTEYANAINHPSSVELVNWQNAGLKDAIYESYLVCNKIYDNIKPEAKLSYRYNFDWIDILNEQLLKGGVRLAKVFNDIYA